MTPMVSYGGGTLNTNNMKLRIAWIILNVFMYLLFIGVGTFVLINADGLRDINRLGSWVFMLILVLFMALFGSFRIWSWIRGGKIWYKNIMCCMAVNNK